MIQNAQLATLHDVGEAPKIFFEMELGTPDLYLLQGLPKILGCLGIALATADLWPLHAMAAAWAAPLQLAQAQHIANWQLALTPSYAFQKAKSTFQQLDSQRNPWHSV